MYGIYSPQQSNSQRVSLLQLLSLILSLIMMASQVIAKDMQSAATDNSPDYVAKTVTQQLLDQFMKDKQVYQKDNKLFLKVVDEKLSPVVAFDSIALGVMGKYSRRANNAQKRQFAITFKDSLLSFYGTALLQLDDTHLSITSVAPVSKETLQAYKEKKIRLVPVEMQVKTSDKRITLTYSMIYDNRWKLRNIIVDGINIGIQFRNQFADAMNQHKDLQYVISHWQQIMQSAEQK